MTLLRVLHDLRWVMRLTEERYTTWTLTDGTVRWGWTVNAGETGWTAHVGDWGQAEDVDASPPPLRQALMGGIDTAAEARSWIEEQVAAQWKERS